MGKQFYRRLALLLVVSSFLTHTGVSAKNKVIEKVTYYDVSVDSVEDLKPTLVSATPLGKQGNKYFANTDTRVSYTIMTREQGKFCKISKVDTTVVVKMTLPRLTTNNPEVQAEFDTWYEALLAHEQQHADHAIETAKSLPPKLKKLGRKRECDQALRAGSEKANQIIQAGFELDYEYDDRTQHGRTEGAWSLFDV